MRPEQAEYLSLNARLAQAWPVITQSKAPLESADEFATHTDKRPLLEETV